MANKPEKGVLPPPAKTAAETLKGLGSNRDTGLTKAEAGARLATQGAQRGPEKKRHPVLRLARKFWGLSAWMIELIVMLSFFLRRTASHVAIRYRCLPHGWRHGHLHHVAFKKANS